MSKEDSASKETTASSKDTGGQWDEIKKARNRINSQRTRERERLQIEALESEKARLWLSNDAIKYQNKIFREAIMHLRELQSNLNARGAHRMLEGRGATNGIGPAGVPQNIAGLMIANEGGTPGYLGSHAGLGLQQSMMRRTLGLPGAHPLLLNSAPIPGSALFQGNGLPDADVSLFGNTGMPQVTNASHVDGIGGGFTVVNSSAPRDIIYSSERKFEGFDGGQETTSNR